MFGTSSLNVSVCASLQKFNSEDDPELQQLLISYFAAATARNIPCKRKEVFATCSQGQHVCLAFVIQQRRCPNQHGLKATCDDCKERRGHSGRILLSPYTSICTTIHMAQRRSQLIACSHLGCYIAATNIYVLGERQMCLDLFASSMCASGILIYPTGQAGHLVKSLRINNWLRECSLHAEGGVRDCSHIGSVCVSSMCLT